jgi:hypothetical protein
VSETYRTAGGREVTIIGLAEKHETPPPVTGPRHDDLVLTKSQLPALALPVSDDGVVIGVDPSREPAVLGLFRRRPLDLVLVGGVYVTQLIVVRAAATGARIVVETARPDAWTNVAQNTGGGQQCVTIVPVGRVGALGASMQSPVLVIRDAGARPPRSRTIKAAWQSTLTLLPYLDPRAAGLLGTVDMAALQRVSPQEARLAGRVLRLPTDDVNALPALADELTLWCGRQHRRYVYTAPTSVEINLLGNPRRVD